MGDSPIIKLSSPEHQAFWKLPVLFEREGLLAISKPSHLLATPEKHRADDPVLTKELQQSIRQDASWNRERGYEFLDLVHGLDFEASGIALYATDREVHEQTRNLVGSRQVEFSYTTLCHGVPEEDAFSIDLKIAPHPTRRWLSRVNATKGKPASTEFRVVERFRSGALLECRSNTLRQHQIRLHLQQAGFPMIGDAAYGGDLLFLSQLKRKYRPKQSTPEKPIIDRAALHLAEINLKHPLTAEAIHITAPLPKDMTVLLKFLRQFGR